MPLFWFHDSKGPLLVIWSGARAGMRGSMGALSRRFPASMLPGLLRKEISPLRFAAVEITGMGAAFLSLGCEISPLRYATVEMTRGVLANTVISSGAACRYGADGKRAHDTLSREISHRNAARTIRGGDFSTPLRFGRNDGGGGPAFLSLGA